MKNIYIAGPMTGIEDYNYDEFINAARDIRKLRLHPVHTANTPRNKPYSWYMEIALSLLGHSDAIYLLPGWQESEGVTKYELPEAIRAKIPILLNHDDLTEFAKQAEREYITLGKPVPVRRED
jgi:hypothetical protein